MNPPINPGEGATNDIARMYLQATPGAQVPENLQQREPDVLEASYRDTVSMVEESRKPEVLSSWNSNLESRVEDAQAKSKEYLQRLGTEVVATSQETESARTAARSAETHAQQAVANLETRRKETAGVTSSKASAQALEATVKGFTPDGGDLPDFYTRLEAQASSLNVPGMASVIEQLKRQSLSPDRIAPVLAKIVAVHEEQEAQAKEELEKAKTKKEETELEKEAATARLTIRESVSNFAMEARGRFQEASLELTSASADQALAQSDFMLSRRVATDLGIPEHAAENLVEDLKSLVGAEANRPVAEANALAELETALINGFASSREQAGLGGLANAIRTQAGGALAESLGLLNQEGNALALNKAQVETALKAKFGESITVESYLTRVETAVENLKLKSEKLKVANEKLEDALKKFNEVAQEADNAFKAIAEGRTIASMEFKSQIERENAARAAAEAEEAAAVVTRSTGYEEAHYENFKRDSDANYARRASEQDRKVDAKIRARIRRDEEFNAMPEGIGKGIKRMFRKIGSLFV